MRLPLKLSEPFRAFLAYLLHPEGKEQRDVLRRQVELDGLTLLGNRTAFDRAVTRAQFEMNAFVFFDITNFKLYQDGHEDGHKAGDELLVKAALTIRNVAGRYGTGNRCFRYGGDEFVVICPGGVAYKLRDEVEQEFDIVFTGCGKLVHLTGGVGYTVINADRQMYVRKVGLKK